MVTCDYSAARITMMHIWLVGGYVLVCVLLLWCCTIAITYQINKRVLVPRVHTHTTVLYTYHYKHMP